MNDDFLVSIPTEEGLKMLSSNLREGIYEFALVGSYDLANEELETIVSNHNASLRQINDFVFYSHEVDTISFDSDDLGVSYECTIPTADNLLHYAYAIALIKDKKTLISITPIAKIQFMTGIGGTILIKIAFRGEKAEIIFQNSGNFLTLRQAKHFYQENIKPQISLLNSHVELSNTLIKKGII